jgi:hypothetical protein
MTQNAKKEQKSTLDTINSAYQVLSILPYIKKMDEGDLMSFNTNPFTYILKLLRAVGVNGQEIEEFLTNLITVILPAVEMSTKGILLSNLKELISCNTDPRIPNYMRSYDTSKGWTNTVGSGITIDMGNLDYNQMFRISPLSTYGQTMYFGTKDKKIYDLVRADDMNAFIWMVINKGNLPTPVPSDSVPALSGQSLLGITVVTDPENTAILAGKTFTNKNSLIESVAISETHSDDGGIISNTIVPCTINSVEYKQSLNWYENSGGYFNYLRPVNERIIRDYSKERAIFNLQYISRAGANVLNSMAQQNKLKLTILPKPFVHLPHDGEPVWRIKKILFNADGEPDNNGKYSVFCQPASISGTSEYTEYQIIDNKGNEIDNYTLRVYKSDGTYDVGTGDEIKKYDCLYECYPGLTVYEWNYDFIMGMQLFDPVVITSQIIQLACNVRMCANIQTTKSETEYQMKIAQIVTRLMEEETSTVSDCFFTFSNEDYVKMANEANLMRLNQVPFQDNENNVADFDATEIAKILTEFDDNGELQKNIDVLKRTFSAATATIQEEILPEDAYNIQLNFLYTAIKTLTNALVSTIISPKIVLLFEVNKQLIGDKDENLTFEMFIQSMMNVIKSIILEIKDLILQELTSWVMNRILELTNELSVLVLKEQMDAYLTLLKLIIDACRLNIGFGQQSLLDSALAEVNYADIVGLPDQPLNKEC